MRAFECFSLPRHILSRCLKTVKLSPGLRAPCTLTVAVTHGHSHVHCIESRIRLNGGVSAALWETHKPTTLKIHLHPLRRIAGPSVTRVSSPNKISTQRTWFPWTAYSRGAPPF